MTYVILEKLKFTYLYSSIRLSLSTLSPAPKLETSCRRTIGASFPATSEEHPVMASHERGGCLRRRERGARRQLRKYEKMVLPLSKYCIGLLSRFPASIGNILKDGLGRIPASIEIWVLVAPIFRGTQQLFTPPRNFEVNKPFKSGFWAILGDFE